MAELIHRSPIHVRTPQGPVYHPHVLGERRADGMWEGWLEFHAVEGHGPRLRTGRETTQATREGLERWALDLESAYFEGAFGRARVVERD